MINLWDINIRALIAFFLAIIAGSLLFIVYKLTIKEDKKTAFKIIVSFLLEKTVKKAKIP